MHNKALKSLVVSLFCFAFCAWTAGLVKPSANVESQLWPQRNISVLRNTSSSRLVISVIPSPAWWR